MDNEGVYPFQEDAEDGLLLSLKLAGDGISQEIRLAPVEKSPAKDIVEHTITIESNEDVLAFVVMRTGGCEQIQIMNVIAIIAVAAFSGSKISLKQRHEHYPNPFFLRKQPIIYLRAAALPPTPEQNTRNASFFPFSFSTPM
jgi:hypothetical protein